MSRERLVPGSGISEEMIAQMDIIHLNKVDVNLICSCSQGDPFLFSTK